MFADSDRGGMLSLMLADVDFGNLPKWDDTQISNLRNEIREIIRKPNGISKLCFTFENAFKFDHSNAIIAPDDTVLALLRWCALSKGESVAVAFALNFSSIKLLSTAARKALRLKLPEVSSIMYLSEIPEEIKTNLVHFIQNDDDLAAPEVSGNIVALLKESYGLPTLMNNAALGAVKSSLSNSDLGALSKLGDLGRQRINLVAVLEEYGSQCSLTLESFRKVLLTSGLRMDEEQMAAIIVLVIPKSYNPPDSPVWNLEVIADVLNQECRGLNWTLVAKYLDTPRLSIRAEADYQFLARLFVRISGSPIPAAGLLASVWNNRPAQFAMLMLSSSAPRSLVDFTPLISQEQVLAGDGVPVPPNLSWLCVPLYVRLLDLASSGLAMEVLEVIAKAANMYPEYVLTCLAQVQDHSGVRNELMPRLLPMFTSLPGSKPSSLVVMKRLYATNPDVLLRLCCVAFRRSKKVGEVVHVESIVKSLGPQFVRRLEEEGTVEELLSLWCFRADKNEISLEDKIASVAEQIQKNPRSVASFVRQNAELLRPRFAQHGDGVLSFESCAVLIRSVQAVLPMDEVKNLVAIFQQQQSLQQQQIHAAQLMHSQQNGGVGLQQQPQHSSQFGRDPVREIVEAPDVARLPPAQESEDVEGIANLYFQKIYTADISIPEVITLMRQFKSSAEKKEQEIFRCMVHNLFDEYRFFHKYPEKELHITGRLFGALIQHQLVSSITLGIALRYVLEALRKDPEQGEGNDKMFRFGQIALDQFRSRLGEWPQYCSHLIQIPHLSRHTAELFQEAQRALSNPASTQSPAVQQQQQTPMQPPAGHAPGSASSQFSTPSYDFGAAAGAYSSFPSQPPPSFPPIQPGGPNSGSALSLSGSLGAPQFPGVSLSNGAGESSSVLGVAPTPKMPVAPVSVPAGFPVSSPVLAPIPATTVVEPVVVPVAACSNTAANDTDGDALPVHREIDRMLEVNKAIADPLAPPDAIRDQVQFVINNVAKNNLEAKTNELKEILKPEFFAWFASYLVEKRVSSQPNLHPLYLTMLDTFQMTDLHKHILEVTYYNVTKFLSSPIITTSSNERSVLRNFGMWLGQLTLARNKPLLQRRINIKELIFWGYETGRLIAVCSFIAKVIEGAKESKVFRPPNPWLMAILGVLKELNEVEDLKLNIKFEVQALCKNINVKIDEIPKSNVLINCRCPTKDQRNPDFNLKASQSSAAAAPVQPSPVQGGLPAPAQPVTVPLPVAATVGESAPVPGTSGLAVDISASVIINPALQFFTSNPNQRRLVVVAVERGIREIIGAAVDRAVSIASATTKQLITKDFANESNDVVVRNAAHVMVSSLTSSLALAICKEPLRISIINHMRTLLAPVISDQTLLEQIVQVCSNDNIDIGSVLIEKASIEKAVKEIDDALGPSLLARKKAKEAGQGFVDSSAAQLPAKFSAELQDLLRFNPAGVTPAQLQLYEAFQRVKGPVVGSPQATGLGGTSSVDAKSMSAAPLPGPVLSMTQALEAYQALYTRIDAALKTVQAQAQGREIALSMLGNDHEVVVVVRDLILVSQRIQPSVRNETAMTFSETLFHKMFDSIANPDPLRLEVSVAILEAVREACGGAKVFNPDVMSWLGKCALSVSNDDISRKVCRHILILLLRAKLVRAVEIDRYLAIHMDGGRHTFWLEVALSFIKQCFVENLCNVYDFTSTLDTITKMRPTSMIMKKQLQKWITDIRALATAQEEQRAAGGSSGGAPSGQTVPALNRVDPALKEQVTILLDRWLRVWNNVTDQVFAHFLQLMHQVGVLKTEDAADRFFRIATDICVDACIKAAPSPADPTASLNYTVVDALVRLFLLLIRVADKETSDVNVRVNLLNRVLNAILRSFLEDVEVRKNSSQPLDERPYYRLLSSLSQDLGIPDPKVESNAVLLPLLNAYTQAYLAIQPSTAPCFAFSWLQLISKRWFMPHLLRTQKCWPAMHRLLSALFVFLQPFLKAGQLPEAVKKLYKGTLRVLLILLHDFPEFLCDFHLSFCDLIPPNCVQLRNLILSAFPRTMRLPDPFTPNLKVDILAEINHSPRILTDYVAPIMAIRGPLDSYMSHQQPADLPGKLSVLLLPNGGSYNLSLLTSLVVYVGSVWIAQLQNKVQASNPTPGLDIFKALLKGLDSEGRYFVINAMANQLRYPNSHTSLFSHVLLTLFAESEDEFVQEQITRVLLERLIVNRPHPWGLLITFIELIKNPKFAFWKKPFTRGDPEVEKVFETIARSCIGTSAAAVIQSQVSGQSV